MSSIPEYSINQIKDCYYLMFKTKDLITSLMKNFAEFDQYNVDISSEIINRYDNGDVLDIGANMGTYVIPLAKKHPRFTFHCFEPQKIINYQLTTNILINRLNNVISHRVGLSDLSRFIDIVVPNYHQEHNIGAFSIDSFVRDNFYECSTLGEFEKIELKKLDEYGFSKIQLIKIDVEGHELDVLYGALGTIMKNNYPTILLECWTGKPWYQGKADLTKKFLIKLGYQLYSFKDDIIAQHPNRVSLEKDIIDNSPFSILDTPLP